MNKKIADILKYLGFLGIGVFLVWWSLHQIPPGKWKDFRAAFASANYWLIVPVFFILVCSHILRAIRWKLLMVPMGYNPSIINTFFAVMIGYLANLAVPRLGEVLKCTILAKYEQIPAEKLVGTIVAERAFDLLCLILLFIVAFALQFDVIGDYGVQFFRKLFGTESGHINFVKIAIVTAVVVLIVVLLKTLFRRHSTVPFLASAIKIINGIGQGIISVKDLQQKWLFFISSMGIWFMYLMGTWIGFNGTEGTSGLSLEIAISALAFGSIGMIITPGGIGAYAFFIARVLQKNAVPFELGFANGTLQWFAQFLIIIFTGFISLGLLPYYNKKTSKNEETGSYPI